MPEINSLFSTHLYQAQLELKLNAELEDAAMSLAKGDRTGIQWCLDHLYRGYTSYSSVTDLPRRIPIFGQLVRMIEPHAMAFAAAEFELGGHQPALDNLWVNVMEEGAVHMPHFHPHSIVSGTYYVTVPDGAGGIAFEDPRFALMMAAPPRKASGPRAQQTFVTVKPTPGKLLLWESWLRHGVEPNRSKAPRISISFNYR